MPEGREESLREKKKRQKMERILEAARALFHEQGYEATTTRMIAERAEVGTGTLFSYVKDKQELLVRIFVSEIDEVANTALDAVDPEAPLLEQLMGVFDAIYDWYDQDRDLGRHILSSMLFLRPKDDRRMRGSGVAFVQRLGQLIEAAKARGEVRQDVLPLFAGAAIFSNYFFNLVSWLSGSPPTRKAQSQMLREFLRLTIDGIGAR